MIPVYIYEPGTGRSWDVKMPAVPRVGDHVNFGVGPRYLVTTVIWRPDQTEDPVMVRVSAEDHR